MCPVTAEKRCPQNVADILWKAGHSKERRGGGGLIPRRSRRKGGSAPRGAVLPRHRGEGPSLASGSRGRCGRRRKSPGGRLSWGHRAWALQ